MSEQSKHVTEQSTLKKHAVERLSQLGVVPQVDTNGSDTLDLSHLAPAPREGNQVNKESLEMRGFRFITQDVFNRIDQNKMFPDPEDERWGDLHSATVLYSDKDDITLNVYTRLYLLPETDNNTGEPVGFLASKSTTFSLVSQGGSVTTKNYILNRQGDDPDALEGFEVVVDFFKGKYPPNDESYDKGYKSLFSMNPDEAAYLVEDEDEGSVQHLGHLEMTSYSDGESSLYGYTGGMYSSKRITVSDIDTFAKWVRSSNELYPEV